MYKQLNKCVPAKQCSIIASTTQQRALQFSSCCTQVCYLIIVLCLYACHFSVYL
jgi:hypothetical protein